MEEEVEWEEGEELRRRRMSRRKSSGSRSRRRRRKQRKDKIHSLKTFTQKPFQLIDLS